VEIIYGFRGVESVRDLMGRWSVPQFLSGVNLGRQDDGMGGGGIEHAAGGFGRLGRVGDSQRGCSPHERLLSPL
jgi:hypothetical protein